MRTPKSRVLSLALVAALAFPIAGCARNSRAKGDTPYVARDVGTLYTAAKQRLDTGQYKAAAILFDEVERQHPYSVWARRAQLMSAYSYYLDSSYTESIQSAQRFLSVHPGNRDAPYAYYLIALGYYEQIRDVTRDQKITRQALDALGELVRRYPTTRYAEDARLKIDLVQDHLAGKEMEVGRFYETRGQWLAATMRFRTVVDDYQTTPHVPEALMRLTETYLQLGVPTEAEKAAAVLGHNYPGTDWYGHAFKLMKDHPYTRVAPVPAGQPVVAQGTPGSVSFGSVNTVAPTPKSTAPAAPASNAVAPQAPSTPATTGGASPSSATGTAAPGAPAPGTTPGA